MFYKDALKKDGMLFTKAVKKVYSDTISTDRKDFIRKDIQDEVFTIEDSVADNSKTISLLLTIVSRMYEAMNPTDKANIPPADVATIDYVINSFKTVQTRADIQFAAEGPALVDKLLARQGKIGEIVSRHL